MRIPQGGCYKLHTYLKYLCQMRRAQVMILVDTNSYSQRIRKYPCVSGFRTLNVSCSCQHRILYDPDFFPIIEYPGLDTSSALGVYDSWNYWETSQYATFNGVSGIGNFEIHGVLEPGIPLYQMIRNISCAIFHEKLFFHGSILTRRMAVYSCSLNSGPFYMKCTHYFT